MRQIGFTLHELVIVLMLAGLLLTITIRSLASLEPRYAVAQARDGLMVLHAEARAQAIESGSVVRLNVDSRGDSAWLTRHDTTLAVTRFVVEHGVELAASRPVVSLCMSPQGYSDMACNSFEGPVSFAFRRGPDVVRAVLLPLGQLEVVDVP